MAKQLNVNLAFTADTSKAKTQMQELQHLLSNLSKGTNFNKNLPITGEIIEAQAAAKALSQTLNEAFNISTGKLDLSKFNNSLKQSGLSLQDYSNKLSLLGKEGDQAFLRVAQSVITTEAPLRRTNHLLTDFATTLKNTARWQISSSVLHGFMGSLQQAHGYAKDLNKSLNDIRIVTGYDVEHMKEFAVEANKAAKALSATTTEYTKASLIYYQQGLSDSEVQDRTDITIKMAHAAGESAEIVSDQLTAIWNNFYDGSKSLEHYADVMTALGAATASSTDEIAGGLEKFASIAEMIGLSYEYAASALATITATTRQSEDVVGTALKTIFARIQGLKLGETLDDGTDLNKYSDALRAVGINIFNTSGQLKEMDDILDEMGDKWTALSKDQQVALAQTVAGVRQYNQLVSLMDNWDFFEENLAIANNSSGALQEQADIYAESWEAARDRVRASAEAIYQSLLKDDLFIGMNDAIAVLLGEIKSLVDSVGGLKGVLFAVGTVATSVFKEQMAAGINNSLQNFRIFSGAAQSEMQKMQQEAYKTAMAMTEGLSDKDSVARLRESLQSAYILQNELRNSIKGMSPEQAESARQAMELANSYHEAAIEAAKTAEQANEIYLAQKKSFSERYGTKMQSNMSINNDLALGQAGGDLTKTASTMIDTAKNISGLDSQTQAITNAKAALENYRKVLHDANISDKDKSEASWNLVSALDALTQATKNSADNFNSYSNKVQGSANKIVSIQSQFESLKNTLDTTDAPKGKDLGDQIVSLANKANRAGMPFKGLNPAIKEYKNALKTGDTANIETSANKLAEAFRKERITIEQVNEAIVKHALKQAGLTQSSNISKEALLGVADAARQEQIKIQGAGEAANLAGKKTEEAAKKIRETGLAYKSLGSAVVGTVQGLSSFAMAASSIMSLTDTLKNDELSGLEKSLQIMTSLGFIIPGLATGWTALGNAIAFTTARTEEGFVAHMANLFGLSQEEKQLHEVIVSKTGQVIATDAATVATMKETAAIDGNTVVTHLNTKAVWSNIGAKILAHKWILLVTGALAILATGLTIATKLYNEEKTATEEAAEASKNAAEIFENTQNSYNTFKDNLQGYSKEIEGLKGLTETTLEYKEALVKTNDAAMELIRNNDLIYGKDYSIDNGVINIKSEALEQANYEQLKKLEDAQSYKAFASQREKNADIALKEVEFNRKYAQDTGVSKDVGAVAAAGISTTAAGAAIGAAIGSAIFPAVGTAIGTIGGALVGALSGLVIAGQDNLNKVTDAETQALRVLQQKYDEIGNSVFTPDSIKSILSDAGFSDELANSLASANEETEKMVIALSENTAVIKASTEQSAKSANRDNKDYQKLSSDDKKLADKIIARKTAGILANPDSKEYKAALEKSKALFSGNDQDAYDKYLENRFGEDASNYRITNQAGTNATLQRKNEGVWETVGDKNGLTNDEVIEYNARQSIIQYDKSPMEDDLNEINSLGALADEIKGINEDAIDSIKGNLAAGEIVDTSVLSPEQVAELQEKLNGVSEGAGEGYANALKNALDTYDEEAYNQRQEREANSIISRGAADLEMDPQALEAYAEHLMETNEALEDNKKLAAEAAVASAKFSISLDKLEKAVKDNADTIREADKDSLDYFESIGKVGKAIKDAFNVDVDSDFIVNNLDKIEQAATGDVEAVNTLRQLLSEEIVWDAIKINDIDVDESQIQSLMDKINSYDSTIKIDADVAINNENFIQDAQALVDASKMTAEQAQAYFNTLGYEPEFVTEEKTVTRSIPQETTHTDYAITKGTIDILGAEVPIPTIDRTTTTAVTGYKDMEEKIQVPALSNDGSPKIKTIRRTGSPIPMKSSKSSGSSGSKKGKSGGGKSSSPAKKKELTKQSEVVDRYHEINNAIEDMADALSDVNRESDRLYGKNKIQAMEKESQIIKQQVDLLKQKKGQVEKNLRADKNALQNNKYKIKFEFDKDNGNILNYTSIMQSLYNELHKAELKANTFKTSEFQSKYEETTIQPIENKIKEIKDLISQYEDTNKLFTDVENEIVDKFNEWQDKNFEKLSTEIEIKVEINDSDLKVIDYYLNKISDDFYKLAEAAGYMTDQIEPYQDNLNSYKNYENQLQDAFNSGKISQADYIEGLKDARDQMYDQLSALNDLDKEMLHYYEDTLDKASQELDKYTGHMEHLTGVLDHYTNLMNILGKQKDYESIDNFLSGKASTLGDQLKVAQSNYEMLLRQKETIQERLANEIEGSAAYEVYKNEWDAIIKATDEAQEEVLSLTEQWAESMKAVIENNLESAANALEDKLTGGTSFDNLMTELDRLNTRQEEYLTRTNQVYETNKLMRTASQSVDKTDNEIAKKKLNNFIAETKQLQQNNQLSKYELEIQKAKYDLLVAEMALEDAKQTKNSMRLVRNSQGNYDYVYTADEEQINNAQQEFEDAQNNLYNISLNGQKDYTEKYMQALQQMYSELKELQTAYLNGEIASEEEYNLKKTQITEHYLGENGILTTYSHLYNIAFKADTNAAADNWFKQYGEMTQSTEKWKDSVNDYLEQVENEFKKWEEVSAESNKNVGEALTDSANATEKVIEESQKLADIVSTDVINTIESEIEAVESITSAYAEQREQLQKLITEYERYLALLGQKINTQITEGSIDYSQKMAQAHLAGDADAYNYWMEERKKKEKLGFNTSITTEELNSIIKDKNNKNLVEQAAGGNKVFTEEYLKQHGIKRYATGGYTGEWGPEGKLGILDEKELILNQNDTENLLSIVDTVRDIGPMLFNKIKEFLNNNIMMNNNLLNGQDFFGKLDANNNKQSIEQNIVINADFPGVSTALEIETALNNLTNDAIQYVRR